MKESLLSQADIRLPGEREECIEYLAMAIGCCIAPAYGPQVIAEFCNKHKGKKFIHMVNKSCIAYFFTWLESKHLVMDECHQRMWNQPKEEQAKFRKSKRKMTESEKRKYTLVHKPKFTKIGQRGYIHHGTTKEGVKIYKEMLKNLQRTSAANFDLLEIAWDEWATKSNLGKE